jgi:hypothetical protein
MRRGIAAAAGAIVLMANVQGARGQDLAPLPVAPGGVEAPARVDEPERVALARRYIADTHFESVLRRNIDTTLPGLFQSALKSNRSLSSDQKAAAESALRGAMSDLVPRIMSKAAEAIAASYTLEELKALTAFYESPIGVSISAKRITSEEITAQAIKELGPEMIRDVIRRVCARGSCPPEVTTRP